MGMYDDFVYHCPNCGKGTSSQTKMGECSLLQLTFGSEFPRDGKILMKNPCEHCGEYNTVIVVDGIITGFERENEAIFEEGCWGSLDKIDKDDALDMEDAE